MRNYLFRASETGPYHLKELVSQKNCTFCKVKKISSLLPKSAKGPKDDQVPLKISLFKGFPCLVTL